MTAEKGSSSVPRSSDPAETLNQRKLYGLLSDIQTILSLYDNTMRIYGWQKNHADSENKGYLANEQLDETRESKATAISLGKLSNLAFLYLPLNFGCAMVGMNMSIFGQGEVPVWVFVALVVFFGLLKYLPIVQSKIDLFRAETYKAALKLARSFILLAFWFLAFSLAYNYAYMVEIIYLVLHSSSWKIPSMGEKVGRMKDKFFLAEQA